MFTKSHSVEANYRKISRHWHWRFTVSNEQLHFSNEQPPPVLAGHVCTVPKPDYPTGHPGDTFTFNCSFHIHAEAKTPKDTGGIISSISPISASQAPFQCSLSSGLCSSSHPTIKNPSSPWPPSDSQDRLTESHLHEAKGSKTHTLQSFLLFKEFSDSNKLFLDRHILFRLYEYLH